MKTQTCHSVEFQTLAHLQHWGLVPSPHHSMKGLVVEEKEDVGQREEHHQDQEAQSRARQEDVVENQRAAPWRLQLPRRPRLRVLLLRMPHMVTVFKQLDNSTVLIQLLANKFILLSIFAETA